MRGFESTAWRNPIAVRKTMPGTGMVTAAKTVTVTYESGRSEVLKAGVTRLSPENPLVKQRPGLFLPADTDDRATATRMLQSAERRERVLEQATRTQPPRARASTPPRASGTRTSCRNASHHVQDFDDARAFLCLSALPSPKGRRLLLFAAGGKGDAVLDLPFGPRRPPPPHQRQRK